MTPQINQLYILREKAFFESLQTGKRFHAGTEMSDEKQGAWDDGPHPYEDDPLYITVEALILTDPLQPMVFQNTNQPVSMVAWSSPSGHWYKTEIENLVNVGV